jgi:hypothetical protein
VAGDGDTGFFPLHLVDYSKTGGLELGYRYTHALKVVSTWSFFNHFVVLGKFSRESLVIVISFATPHFFL